MKPVIIIAIAVVFVLLIGFVTFLYLLGSAVVERENEI